MADKTVTIKPSGGTYHSFADAIAGELIANSNLITMGGNLILSIEGDWSGTTDTTAVYINGFTGDATHRIIVKTDAANRAVKTGWTTSRYQFNISGAIGIRIDSWYVDIDGLQISCDPTGDDQRCLTPNATDVNISNCRIRNLDSDGTYYNQAIRITGGPVNIWNCIMTGFLKSPYSAGIEVASSVVVKVYNSDVYGNYLGIWRDLGTVTATNCAVFNNTDDFGGTITIAHCASDDNDAESIAESGGGAAWPNDFSDAANGDFTLLSGSGLVGTGTDDPGSGLYSDDIDGVARTSTWDIGADEYVAAGGGQPAMKRFGGVPHMAVNRGVW